MLPVVHPTSPSAKKVYIAEKIKEILEALELDLSDPSLAATPERVAAMYVDELFSGLDPDNFPEITTFPCESPQIVRIDAIRVSSVCEHHLLPFSGSADVAYIPQDRVLGLSKVHRIVDYFARRPQLQERLTGQVADCLMDILGIDDVGVRITAQHGCVTCRGVEDVGSTTTTLLLRGRFDGNSPF